MQSGFLQARWCMRPGSEKHPDESKRPRPRDVLIRQGLHLHPAPPAGGSVLEEDWPDSSEYDVASVMLEVPLTQMLEEVIDADDSEMEEAPPAGPFGFTS